MSALFDQHPLYAYAITFVVAFGAITFPVLFFISAPYGKHQREGWGPLVPAKLGWILMEAPSPIGFAAVFLYFEGWSRPLPILFAAMFLTHYVYRAFIFPLRMRGAGKTKPLLTTAMAFVFNCANGPANAYAITQLAPHLDLGWLMDARFWVGTALFSLGYYVNHQSDAILRNLREPGENGYKIPRGGLYEYVSSPNYLGEIVEWIGWAVATWTLAGAAFAFFTFANLVPRAVSNHQWYREKFDEYPRERRAVLPFVW